MMLKLANRVLRSAGFEVRRRRVAAVDRGIVATIRPKNTPRGAVLISYVPDDVSKPENEVSPAHTHFWECRYMAESYAKAGFLVDVIDFADKTFKPAKHYDILVSARTNLERLAKHLSPDCLKIAHLDTAHFLTHNANALARLRDIRDRHGIALRSNRMLDNNWAIEAADMGCVLGNAFTGDSYAYAGKPIHRIPLSSVRSFDWQEDKDFEACRDTFLWFGSGGFAHKGLDLVIDAFARLPDLRLIICGPVDLEPRFVKAFNQAMFHSDNIETLGWVDVTSNDFEALRQRTLATIYPSCSEGGGGCVITCMHAGMIPVVTPEASVDIGDSGILLKSATIEAICGAARTLSKSAPDELAKRARSAWSIARENHTRDTFASHYDRFLNEVVLPEVERRQVRS